MKDELPDSRTILTKKTLHTKLGWSEAVYCVNCGVLVGMCSEDLTKMFYICDVCAEKHGPPAGAEEVPEYVAPKLGSTT